MAAEALRPLLELGFIGAPNATGIVAFAKRLQDLDQVALTAAVERYISESEQNYFPTIGILRRFAAEYRSGSMPDWGVVWSKIMEAKDHWRQEDKKRAFEARAMLGDSLMEWVRFLGGFYELANCSPERMSVLQSNFRNEWTRQAKSFDTQRKLPSALRPSMNLLKHDNKKLNG